MLCHARAKDLSVGNKECFRFELNFGIKKVLDFFVEGNGTGMGCTV